MKKTIKLWTITLALLFTGIPSVISATSTSTQPKIQSAPIAVSNISGIQEIKAISLVNNPTQYLNKKIKITAKFDKFSTLGLDYKPAFKSSENYISFMISREENKDIPLSELKLFMKREEAEKYIDLNAGDTISFTGLVFSDALGDPWVEIIDFKVLQSNGVKK